MKKTFFLFVALLGVYSMQAQGFGIALSGGYLSELDGGGGSADLIYEIDEKWGVFSTFTFAAKDDTGVRAKWTIFDLNGRYKVVDEIYVLAGGEYLSVNLKELGLAGGNPLGGGRSTSNSNFGVNAGAGYIYNLLENVNLFVDVKYVFLEKGYLHSRIGILFDL